MSRVSGFGKRVLMAACAVAVGVAFVWVGSNANAGCLPAKIAIIKPGKLFKIVAKPPKPALFAIPGVEGSGTGPDTLNGSLLVSVEGDTGTLACDLSQVAWKGLGKPAGAKGWKYINKSAPTNDPCKVVIVKEKVIKVLAKSSGTLPSPAEDGVYPAVTMSITAGAANYTAFAAGPHFKVKAGKLVKMKGLPAPDCSAFDGGTLAFVTGIPSGQPDVGTLSNHRCSNDVNLACVTDAECDVGTCFVTPPLCSGNNATSCSSDADCVGTCEEQPPAGNLPLGLVAGGLYTGGGANTVPLPMPLPDRGESYTRVSVSGDTLTLSRTTPAEVGIRHCTQGRTCSEDGVTHCVLDSDCSGTCDDNCTFGPPLPIPNSTPGSEATSVCAVNVVDTDAVGTANCGGEGSLSVALRSVVHLSGDLFKATTPPDIPGIQPCPLCQGGDPDIVGSGTCLGGPNNGLACTPETSDSTALGDPEGAYPTSHDCPPDPLTSITSTIGGLPIDFVIGTDSQELNGVDRTGGRRNFCGFCRDVDGLGTECFEGNTDPGCPAAIPAATGNGVACNDDSDCADADEYESCVQADAGAFSESSATKIVVAGSSAGCLATGGPVTQNQVGIFCIPPTFNDLVDTAGSIPGPGTSNLFGTAQLAGP